MKEIITEIGAKVEAAFAAAGYDAKYGKVTASNRPDLCDYQCNGALQAAKAYGKKPIDIAGEIAGLLGGAQADTGTPGSAAVLDGASTGLDDAAADVDGTGAGEFLSTGGGVGCGAHIFSEAVAVMPGFINLKLDPVFLADYCNRMKSEPKCGLEETAAPKTIIVDYGGANVAKPLHVGHLRSAVIGEAIKRLGAFLGNHMIGDIHMGDWGLQMGLIIEELRERQPGLEVFRDDEAKIGKFLEELASRESSAQADPSVGASCGGSGEEGSSVGASLGDSGGEVLIGIATADDGPAPFTISELEDIYPAASARSKEDAAFRERAQQATFLLQQGYPPYRQIWRHIMGVSLPDLHKNYDRLDVHFELWKGESDAQPYIPGLIKMLRDKGVAYESQGALVVDIAQPGDAKELPPCIVQKSDGAALYATSDLGTIVERERDIHPDAYIYLTDKRQELHFTQVFRVAKKAGIVGQDVPMRFLGFGTMNGKDNKPFKTRDGGVMRLEDLIGSIDEAVYARMTENENKALSPDEARETAKIVGMAALKYGDLSNQATKDYIFDIDKFSSLEGNTGPYILYTMVRIKSILKKYAADGTVATHGTSAADGTVATHGTGAADVTGETDVTGAAVVTMPTACGESAMPADGIGERVAAGFCILPAVGGAERNLALQLVKYSEAVRVAFEELAPHKVCQYIFELSNEFNRFYHDNKILTEPDEGRKRSWLALSVLTLGVLECATGVLGIEAPSQM
ncbi:MAG: arginine--tRNA ligase [Lachnospiraceae bacterium]|jgi:arginyl-tRNA synthetase|nr:arginine--tRNA ligase [Lachnospiraceae bacterium]